VAEKSFEIGGQEVKIPYSWLTQALEQEYGSRFVIEQFQQGQLAAHEAEFAAYLHAHVFKLILWKESMTYRFDPYTDEELVQPLEVQALRLRTHEEINTAFKKYLVSELSEEKVVFAIAMLTDEAAEDDLIELCDDDDELNLMIALIAGFKKGSVWQDEVSKVPASLALKLKQYFDLNVDRMIMRWETVRDKHDPVVGEENE
jgi:hypothetical protein